MHCPKCSTPAREAESHCRNCGADLRPTPTTADAETSAVSSARPLDFAPGTQFAGRFTIVEKAGEGGMGVVYKAIDTALDLVVALKLIRPDLAGVPAFVHRFRQEVRLTRQITHPNVCRVHDLGESEGILYLSMEWIAGETLRRLLNQAGALEPARAVEIAEKITQALGAAHAKEIIHRDLKPENVMIDNRGAIFVMDFGIAVGRGPVASHGTGGAAGTPAYMSPEQRRGDPPDRRSDLFALGLILVEMLTGRAPNPDELLPLQLPQKARKTVGPVLERLLADDKEERYPSAEATLEALRQIMEKSPVSGTVSWKTEKMGRRGWHLLRWGGAAAVLLGASLLSLWRHAPRSDGSSQKLERSSPGGAYYERGLHYLREEGETLRTLGDATQMFHRALEKDPNHALAWAGLGEAYWNRYEQTQETFDKEEAVRAVEKSLQLSPGLPEAHQARGVGYLAEANFSAARIEFETALRKRPDLDAAWEGLGTACRELEKYSDGLKALKTAIGLKPASFHHYIALGSFFEHFAEYDEAASAYRKAIDLKPNSTWAWNNLGAMFLYLARRPEDAVPAFQRSLDIEERGSARSNLGTAFYYQGKYQQAMQNYQRATKLEPKEASTWENLGDSLQMLGQKKESLEAYREAVRLAGERVSAHPLDPSARNELARYCAKKGEKDCALREGTRAAEMQPGNAEIAFTNAIIRCVLGRDDEALDWLERAVKLGLSRVEIEHEPHLAPLHTKPRYRQIVELAS